MESLGKIVQRAPAVGAKTWCFICLFLLPVGAAKRQPAGIVLLSSQKINILPLADKKTMN